MTKYVSKSGTKEVADVAACLAENGIQLPKIPTGPGTPYVTVSIGDNGVARNLTTGNVHPNSAGNGFESVAAHSMPVPFGTTNIVTECIQNPLAKSRGR